MRGPACGNIALSASWDSSGLLEYGGSSQQASGKPEIDMVPRVKIGPDVAVTIRLTGGCGMWMKYVGSTDQRCDAYGSR